MKEQRGGGRRGSIKKIGERDLGGGLRLEVHKLEPPREPAIRAAMQRAVLWATAGFRSRAARKAREVWQRCPGDKFVDVWTGQMLAKYGEREEAAEVYCASEGLAMGDWQAYWHLGQFLHMAGLHARAIEFLKEAVRIEPRAVDAHLDLARCFAARGRSGEARKSLETARQLDPRAEL